mmetsp:Transcript_11837/g.17122  ORF Transcript_11837/g.17122 Transcript_11837/m.17122 type:complete len:288 (-) Transcript_11837:1837-2700(-)
MLVVELAKKLNFFPPQGGVSEYYSPRMILHQENLDFNRHCAIPFGQYVQAYDDPDPKNNQAPHTLHFIYLCADNRVQGGHELLDPRTGRMISRGRVTPVPITQSVPDLVHKMARHDGMPNGLKITTRTGDILYDSALIAGVDYNPEVVTYDDENSLEGTDDNIQEGDDELDDEDYEEVGIQEVQEILADGEVNQTVVTEDAGDDATADIEDTVEEPAAVDEEDTEEPEVEEPAPPPPETRQSARANKGHINQYDGLQLYNQTVAPVEYEPEEARVLRKRIPLLKHTV